MKKSAPSGDSFHYMDTMCQTSDLAISLSQIKRRRMAQLLRDVINKVARMQATDAEMAEYVAALEVLSEQVSEHDKFDSFEVFTHLYEGEASREELFLDIDSAVLIGKASPIGFPMEFHASSDKITGAATVPVAFQGPPGRVHGGIVAAIFDVLLSRTQLLCEFLGFTADLQISYKSAVPLNAPLKMEAWVEKVDERKLINAGQIIVDGKVCATARGLWIKPKMGFS